MARLTLVSHRQFVERRRALGMPQRSTISNENAYPLAALPSELFSNRIKGFYQTAAGALPYA